MKKWITDNKVFLASLVSALIVSLQQALSNATNWKAIGWGVVIVILGTIGNQWKGKGVSITGIIGTVAYNFVTVWQTGTFTWNQFILTTVVALLMMVADNLQPSTTAK